MLSSKAIQQSIPDGYPIDSIASNIFQLQLPNADNEGNDLTGIVAGIVERIADVFGGATVSPSHGYWVDSGKSFVESNQTVTVYFADRAYSDVLALLDELRVLNRYLLKQECLFVVINTQAYLLKSE